MVNSKPTTRVTIRDVAKAADVSAVTVSHVLKGRTHKSSPQTCERVLRIAREMNYIPVAQPSTQQRLAETRIIGLVFDAMDWDSYWGMQTFRGMRDGAQELGYDLLTILRPAVAWSPAQEDLRLLDRRSDGLIFVLPINREGTFAALAQHHIPVAACYFEAQAPNVTCVTVDNHGALRAAVELAIANGHRDLLFLGVHTQRSDFRRRHEGYIAGCGVHGIEPRALLVHNEEELKSVLLPQLQALRTTAILCAADSLAFATWNILDGHGWRVPRDISLVGMDDLPEAAERGLTTVRISGAEVGQQAVHAVVSLIQNTPFTGTTTSFQVVHRTSMGPPPPRPH